MSTQQQQQPINNNYFIYQFVSPLFIYRDIPNSTSTANQVPNHTATDANPTYPGYNMNQASSATSNPIPNGTRGASNDFLGNLFDSLFANANSASQTQAQPQAQPQPQAQTQAESQSQSQSSENNNNTPNGHFHVHLDPLSLLFAQFFSQQQQQQQSLQGQPPASKIAMESLKIVSPKSKLIKLQPTCSICMDDFSETPDKCIRSMPCGHVYHEECIFEWLRKSNTCANCRYEIETDNPEYNECMRKRMAERHPVFAEQECALSQQGCCDYEDQNGEFFDNNEEEEQKHIIKTSCGCTFHDTCLRTALLIRGYNVPETGGYVEFRCPKCNKDSTMTFNSLNL